MNLRKKTLSTFFCLLFSFFYCNAYKIGLLIVATGTYTRFIPHLINSANTYFCTNHNVTYFVFTDGKIPQSDQIIKIEQKHLGWPHCTLLRCDIYNQHKEKLKDMDYLFACDADMLFVDKVGDEILFERIATQHQGFTNRRGTYETRPISTAYVSRQEGRHYFSGAFYGGTKENFFHMIETMTKNIKIDLSKKIIAVWHDESHVNRYFIDNQPTKILSPSYCYPETWKIPYHEKLLSVNKKHPRYKTK